MKKYTIALLLVFFCTIYTQAQQAPNLYRAKVDSIQTLIDHQPRVDSSTVKQLNYLAQFCFFDMQFKRGMIATVEARQLAKKLNYAKGEGLYYRTLYFFNPSSYISGYYYNYKAKWAYSDRSQNEGNFQPGVAVPNNMYNEKALPSLDEAVAYFQKHPDKEILANLYNYYVYIVKIAQQAAYIEKSNRLFRENNQVTPQLIAYLNNVIDNAMVNKLYQSKEAEITALKLLTSTKDNREVVLMKAALAQAYGFIKRQSQKFELLYQLDRQLEQMGEKELRMDVVSRLAESSFDLFLDKKAIEYFKKEASMRQEDINNSATKLTYIYHQIAFAYIRLKQFDEAQMYIEKARNAPVTGQSENQRLYNTTRHYESTGRMQMGQGKYEEAAKNLAHSITYADKTTQTQWLSSIMRGFLSESYQKMGKIDEAIKEAKTAYDKVASIRKTGGGGTVTKKTSLLLYELYEKKGDPLEAYKYLQIYQKIREEADKNEGANQLQDAEIRTVIEKEEQNRQLQSQRILDIEKQREIDGLKAEAEKQLLQTKAEQAERDKKIEKERLEAKALENKRQQDYKISLLNLDIDSQRKIRTGLLGGLGVFALLLAVLFQQNRAKQRFNQTLAKQKEQIEHQRDQLDKTVTDLKSTQNQLIQKEKLASLGELTAGIAHEIQNPLNFVNNFSELSVDLAKEIQEERKKEAGERDEELIDDLVDDLAQNQAKISHHGKRASSIVKGMLEHSRTSSGKKELTDINALAEEYLKLAYHGVRAKDNKFNADFKTDLDKNLPKIEIQAQDMGRVLLNVINNAFYATQQKTKLRKENYQPSVTITTKNVPLQGLGVIRVKDNGTGMSEAVKTKIFQPFFTTKPTGEGTGLGLSLAYDIVTKGHGGTLEVESVEGEGTEFIIRLPISDKTI